MIGKTGADGNAKIDVPAAMFSTGQYWSDPVFAVRADGYLFQLLEGEGMRPDVGIERLFGKLTKREQPKPTHRPPPSLAMGADRAAFQRRWREDHERALKSRRKKSEPYTPEPSTAQTLHVPTQNLNFLDAEYRSIFIAGRKAQMQNKGKSKSR